MSPAQIERSVELACEALGVPEALRPVCEALALSGPHDADPVSGLAARMGRTRRWLWRRTVRAGIPTPKRWAQLGTCTYIVCAYMQRGTAQEAIRGSRIPDQFQASQAIHGTLGVRFGDVRRELSGRRDADRWTRWVVDRWLEAVA